jgi:predicted benzoate:H+ symporter BenE
VQKKWQDLAGPGSPGPESKAMRAFRFDLRELGGAFGDLGTFLPHVISVITVGGLPATGVLYGFGLFYMATGLLYRLPVPVQPMKAVSAVIVTAHLPPGAVAATGIILGVLLLALALSGAIERIARLVPASVVAGLQLGLGLSLLLIGFELLAAQPWLGLVVVALALGLTLIRGCPATLIALAAALLLGRALGLTQWPADLAPQFALPGVVLPRLADIGAALHQAVLPQIALTVTNAIIVTAALSRSLFPDGGDRVSERRLALSSGAANLLLCPFGALPMCHGAGGLQAHYRFGARSGTAPIVLGVLLLALAVAFAGTALDLLALIPLPAVGALLVIAAADLAFSKRLFDARPVCWPAIAGTALGTVLLNAAVGLAVGCLIELARHALREAPWRRQRQPRG